VARASGRDRARLFGADDGAARLTKNPYQRAAAACAGVALVLSLAGAQAASPIPLGVGLVFAIVAYVRRRDYPR
jgi:hypothetical protein